MGIPRPLKMPPKPRAMVDRAVRPQDGSSVASALSRIKQLAEQHPSLAGAFLLLLRNEHKAALDKLRL